jgi:bifunctional DNase/RNase
MVEVTVHDVVVRVLSEDEDSEVPRLASGLRVVLLKEKGGGRVLPIWVGLPEGDSLALQLGGESTPRPMTADLMARLLEAAGARIERVTVSSLRENTFYASITLATNGDTNDVDARPSDAINLAVRVAAQIYVASELREKAISVDDIEGGLEREREARGAESEPPGTWRSLSPELVSALREPPPGCK